MPRDRNGTFEPAVVKKHQKNVTSSEDQILALYAKGVTTREIQDYLNQLYGVEVSPTLISNVTGKILPMIKGMAEPTSATCLCDRLSRRHSFQGAGGRIDSEQGSLNGHRGGSGRKQGRFGHMDRRKREQQKFWLSVLNGLKNRGVQDILIMSVDNLTGFSEAIQASFPATEIQKCIVHQVRNSVRYVSYKDLKKVTSDLKPICQAASEALEDSNCRRSTINGVANIR